MTVRIKDETHGEAETGDIELDGTCEYHVPRRDGPMSAIDPVCGFPLGTFACRRYHAAPPQ